MSRTHVKVVLVILLGLIASSRHLRIDANAAAQQNVAPKPASNTPLLNYKRVDWPIPATSSAGFPGGWNFVEVSGVATTPQGNVFVLHRGAYPIMEFESSGKFVRAFGDGLISEGKVLLAGRGVAPTFVAEVPGKTRYSAVYGPAGCTACGAHSIRVDPQGNLWVVDATGHVIYKLNQQGKEIMRLGTKGVSGTGHDTFNLPTDIGFAPTGEIYVADGYGNARLMKFSKEGKYLTEWGTRGKGPGQFGMLHYVVVDPQGRVYIGDRDNRTVQVFDSTGKLLDRWTGEHDGTEAVVLALTPDQRIWTGWVLRDLKGNIVGQLPDEAKGAHGIAVSSSGDVYFAKLQGGSIQKFVKQ